jgi:phosphatidylethanolamine/phosphatidyl-N-methylethanolamine N-methyltransferase
MPMQTLAQFERRYRLFEQIVGKNIDKRVRLIEQHFEEKVERPFRLIEQRISRNIEIRLRRFGEKNGIRLNDEMRFIRSWIEKPLTMGAVTPSSKQLARTMARYVDRDGDGPVIELGPGTGPVTEALLAHGVEEKRLVLLEFNPQFCQLLEKRFPQATVVQADAYRLRESLGSVARHEAAAVVSGLPLMTKPLRARMRLLRESLALLQSNAPFVQFTYAVVPPIPKLSGVKVEASERIWRNMPPARVWVYRQN